jgi:hypothetical protein
VLRDWIAVALVGLQHKVVFQLEEWLTAEDSGHFQVVLVLLKSSIPTSPQVYHNAFLRRELSKPVISTTEGG